MKIDQEMQLWENRSNDIFGTMLSTLRKVTKDYFVPEKNEYGISTSPISSLITLYAVDGNIKNVYERAHNICENWDLMEDKKVARIINKMKNICKNYHID